MNNQMIEKVATALAFVPCRADEPELDLLRRREAARAVLSSVETTEATLGVGDGGGNMFVHGSYDAIKRVQQMIFEIERLSAYNPNERLREALDDARDTLALVNRRFESDFGKRSAEVDKTIAHIDEALSPLPQGEDK